MFFWQQGYRLDIRQNLPSDSQTNYQRNTRPSNYKLEKIFNKEKKKGKKERKALLLSELRPTENKDMGGLKKKKKKNPLGQCRSETLNNVGFLIGEELCGHPPFWKYLS